MKQVIYIAGPFRSRNKERYNFYEQWEYIIRAERVAWNVWAMGGAPLCPHLNTAHFQGSLPDEVWLEGDLAMMLKCDAVLMVSGWEESSGARMEREVAMRNGLPVFYDLMELEGYLAPFREAAALEQA